MHAEPPHIEVNASCNEFSSSTAEVLLATLRLTDVKFSADTSITVRLAWGLKLLIRIVCCGSEDEEIDTCEGLARALQHGFSKVTDIIIENI